MDLVEELCEFRELTVQRVVYSKGSVNCETAGSVVILPLLLNAPHSRREGRHEALGARAGRF